MTQTVSNRKNCFIEAVLLLCKHKHFSVQFLQHDLSCPPPFNNTFRVKGIVQRKKWIHSKTSLQSFLNIICTFCGLFFKFKFRITQQIKQFNEEERKSKLFSSDCNRRYIRNRCARMEQSPIFDLSTAYNQIESSHKSYFFSPKRPNFLHACALCFE